VRPIVAVAIFDNETGRADLDALAATAADVMVARLTALGVETLGVIGNTPRLRQPRAERDPRAVREETGAGYLVFGQLQPDDAGVRLVVHLIRLDDQTHLWVTRVPRPTARLDGIQDAVADRLAEAVRAHVIERNPRAPRFTR
jgi:TolB-like protein